MSFATGLDRLLADPAPLVGRRYGLLAHLPAVTADLVPAHVALAERATPPTLLLGPEHGFYGVEQDMVPSADAPDPWTGVPIRSLYGAGEHTLVPSPEVFRGLDLLVIDLQDVGSRYYTYAATGIWAAAVALEAGCEVWILDRPNPLGGETVEGNLRRDGMESFVGAFATPVRHGLTLGELARLELARQGRDLEGLRVWTMTGWTRGMHWPDTGRPWIAPSPNMPSYATAIVYPGLCLLEATTVSEGRGTTRPFLLFGDPRLDPRELAGRLAARRLPGLAFVPTYFRPQFQKHAGRECGGVEVVVTAARAVAGFRAGVEVLEVLWPMLGGESIWRTEPYEFVSDRPAVDLLAGSADLREALEGGADPAGWIATWPPEEARFRDEAAPFLLYPR